MLFVLSSNCLVRIIMSYLKSYNCKLFVLIVTRSSNCLLRIIISYLKSYNGKLFVLRIFTRSYNCLLRIIISYLKSYNCKLFVLRIFTRRFNCLLRIIINYLKSYNGKLFVLRIATWNLLTKDLISYVKLCNGGQPNDYYQIDIITWNYIFIRIRNTWHHITVLKGLVLDRNIWYITVNY